MVKGKVSIDKQSEWLRIAMSLVIMFLFATSIIMVYRYKEMLRTSPCEYVAEHSSFVCVPNPDHYTNCIKQNGTWECMRRGVFEGLNLSEFIEKEKEQQTDTFDFLRSRAAQIDGQGGSENE